MSETFKNWKDYRDWYYRNIVGRPFDGRPNTKVRRGDQTGEQKFFDQWREHMGFDAPIMNVDILSYDRWVPKAISDLKIGEEEFDPSNRQAFTNLASMSNLPAFEVRWMPDDKKLIVTQLWVPV